MTLYGDVKALLAGESIFTSQGELPDEGPFVILESAGGEYSEDVQRHRVVVRVFSSYATQEGVDEQMETDLRRILTKLYGGPFVVRRWSAATAATVNPANNAQWLNSDIEVTSF